MDKATVKKQQISLKYDLNTNVEEHWTWKTKGDVEEEKRTRERRKRGAKKIRVEKNKRCQHSECKNSYSYLFLSQQLIKYAFECTRLHICMYVCVCVCVFISPIKLVLHFCRMTVHSHETIVVECDEEQGILFHTFTNTFQNSQMLATW